MRIALPVLIMLAAGVPTARADNELQTLDAVAAEVVAAASAAGEPRLRVLARRVYPDPWLVVEALVFDGHTAAAQAYVGAGATPEFGALRRHVTRASARAASAAEREALTRAVAAFEAGDEERCLGALVGLPTKRLSIVAVQIHFLRGSALGQDTQFEARARAFLAAADAARDLGWHAREAEALHHAGLAQYERSAFEAALTVFERRLQVETKLASVMGRGRAWFGISVALNALGRCRDEAKALSQARDLAVASQDYEYISKMLTHDALARARAGDPEACLRISESAMRALGEIDDAGLAARFRSDPTRIAGGRAQTLIGSASWSAMLCDIDSARDFGTCAVRYVLDAEDPTMALRTEAQFATMEGAWAERVDDDLNALKKFERACVLYEQSGDRLHVADSLRRLTTIETNLGDYVKAFDHATTAVEVLGGIGARRELSRAQLRAGVIGARLGRWQAAFSHLGAALRLCRILDDKRYEIEVISSLADVHLQRGDHARALELLHDAHTVQEEIGATEGSGTLLLQVSRTYRSLGDYETALAFARRATDALEAEGDTAGLKVARAELTRLLVTETGDYERGFAVLEGVLAESRQRKSRPDIAYTLSRQADVRFLQGRYRDAVSLRAEALGLFVAMGNSVAALEARVQMGRELFFGGQRERAYDLLKAAFDEADRTDTAHVLRWCALALCETTLFTRRYGEAIEWARRGVALSTHLGLDLADEEGASLRAVFASVHEMGAAAALRAGRLEALHEFLERGRAATLLSALGGRRAMPEDAVPDALLTEEATERAAEARAEFRFTRALRSGRLAETRERKQDLEQVRERVRSVVGRIQRSLRGSANPAFATPRPLAEVQASLVSDEALLTYADVLDEVVALVVTRNEARAVRLGVGKTVTEAVRAMLRGGDGPIDTASVARVRRLLIGALDLSDATRRLLISPDGMLSYVPFSLLAPDHEVALVPSGTTYGVLCTAANFRGKEVLALGNPDYCTCAENGSARDTAATGLLRGRALTPLPGSEREARSVGDVVLIGSDASETRFRSAVTRLQPWRAIHLACHGLLDAQHPTLTSLALTADLENDGFLTALDVFRLRIPAELVVLSGCDTGKGRVVEGEGILGLTRAFMYAGAPRVVVSLWKVDDDATRALMAKLYALWNPKDGSPGLPAATALRQAQQHVRTQSRWEHPRFWAAWVLWGVPD